MTARLRALREERGFTLIELLVVVIIIGVLAAIAIPVYIGVQNSAKDSAATSDLTNAKVAVVAYFTTKGSMPPAIDTATLKDYGFTSSGLVVADASGSTATSTAFCLSTTSGSTKKFWITQSGGATSTMPGGCK